MKESRGCLQDLIGAPEFAVLALEFLDARPLLCRHPGAQSSICLCLAHPFAQRLGGHAQLRRHRADRRPLGVVLSFVFKDQARSLTSRGYLFCVFMTPSSQRLESPAKAGRFSTCLLY